MKASRSYERLGRLISQKHKSTPDILGPQHSYVADPSAYELLEDCGRGMSATVYRALYKPYEEIVAVKKVNLDKLECQLDDIIHEAQTMKQYRHPHILPLYCSFVSDSELWLVTPFMEGGSVAHLMQYCHPQGLDEVLVASIMKPVLEALRYIHKNEGLHRDVKAGNILIDEDGSVQLGDFGSSATMERVSGWGRDQVGRMTFVGTPCWMAPEVLEQSCAYGASADIWSFGITMLELARGHAPFAKMPPMKVLMMTLQGPPPQLDEHSGSHHYSRSSREVVALCLQKNPQYRPSASQLLQHRFFRQAKDAGYIRKHLLDGLPPLYERVKRIRSGQAGPKPHVALLKHEESMARYVQDVVDWDFNAQQLCKGVFTGGEAPQIGDTHVADIGPPDDEEYERSPAHQAVEDPPGASSHEPPEVAPQEDGLPESRPDQHGSKLVPTKKASGQLHRAGPAPVRDPEVGDLGPYQEGGTDRGHACDQEEPVDLGAHEEEPTRESAPDALAGHQRHLAKKHGDRQRVGRFIVTEGTVPDTGPSPPIAAMMQAAQQAPSPGAAVLAPDPGLGLGAQVQLAGEQAAHKYNHDLHRKLVEAPTTRVDTGPAGPAPDQHGTAVYRRAVSSDPGSVHVTERGRFRVIESPQ